MCEHFWSVRALRQIYKRFFSKLARPLYQLLKKDTEFNWTDPEERSFSELHLRTSPVLAYPDFSILCTLYTDVCLNGCGYNLTQYQDSQERAIFYGGRDFTNTEKN